MIRWPFVSRAKYEAVCAELEAERKRARRRERRNAQPEPIDMADATADTSPNGAAATPSKPDLVALAIRAIAGQDRVLARHLRTYATEQRALEVPDYLIAKRIRDGQEVRL